MGTKPSLQPEAGRFTIPCLKSGSEDCVFEVGLLTFF